MKELLDKMLSAEILSEETKQELVEAFNAEIESAKNKAKEDAKLEFATQFAEDKAALVEAIDTKVTAFLVEEIQELKEDIERFRDLEAEYATKLVEEKQALALQLKADMAELVETLDVFLEERLTEEVNELKESIEEVKKIEFAKKLFESIEDIYAKKFFNESGMVAKLEESQAELKNVTKKLKESETLLNKMVREKEMARVLEPLHGRPREIMEAILKSVPTENLDESFNNYIGRVLHESATVVESKSEKENVDTSVLAESDSTANVPDSNEVKVVTGDITVVEQVGETKQTVLSESERARLRRIAGII